MGVKHQERPQKEHHRSEIFKPGAGAIRGFENNPGDSTRGTDFKDSPVRHRRRVMSPPGAGAGRRAVICRPAPADLLYATSPTRLIPSCPTGAAAGPPGPRSPAPWPAGRSPSVPRPHAAPSRGRGLRQRVRSILDPHIVPALRLRPPPPPKWSPLVHISSAVSRQKEAQNKKANTKA